MGRYEQRDGEGRDQPEASAQRELDWCDQWDDAWDAVAAQGGCDTLGGAEYRRCRAQARYEDVAANQTAMRRFIRLWANAIPTVNITTESRKRRGFQTNEGSSDNGK